MMLTYKLKHGKDFSRELNLAMKVAQHSLKSKTISSKDVKHIGLKSMISNQILRKYSRNKKLKVINSVNLTIPGQGIKVNKEIKEINIPCLKFSFKYYFDSRFEKINQIEINKTFVFISVTIKEPELIKPNSYLGVDRNTTGHVLVASNPSTGKTFKLGKSCNHVHKKYKHLRKNLQKKGKFKKLKQIKNREKNIIKDINHKISKKIVNEATKTNSGIVLEMLKGIRKTAKTRQKHRYSLNSWSFYQLEQLITYKSKKQGVPIFYVEPQYTSQACSRCGHIEKSNRQRKLFHCKRCGIVENADVNAGFNIALKHQTSVSQFIADRDVIKGNTDTPKEALSSTQDNFRTPLL